MGEGEQGKSLKRNKVTDGRKGKLGCKGMGGF